MDKPIRVLVIVPNMTAAGIETSIMNNYRKFDRKKVQYDFIVHNSEPKFYDEEIEALGGKIFRFSFKDDKNYFKYKKDLNKFFKEHKEYKIFHGEMQSMMPIYLKIAKNNDVKVRIAHSHNSDYEKSIKGFLFHVLSRFSKKHSSLNLACSKNSGEYLFGNAKFDVAYNGIDTSKFKYDKKIRNEQRKKLEIKDDTIVFGHVGRFDKQKNHKQLIKIYKSLYEKNNNSVLLLIGKGKLSSKIEKIVKKYGLENNVKFLGVRKDVNDLMQAMDIFLLPSLYEGLPMVGVEAQLTSLPCIFSDTITKEVNISDEAYFANNNDIEKWVELVDKIIKKDRSKIKIDREIFDINRTAKELENMYIELYKDTEK